MRLYCLRLSNGILVLGNGGVKNSRTYEEDDSLRGYVLDLQKFEELLKEGQGNESVIVRIQNAFAVPVSGCGMYLPSAHSGFDFEGSILYYKSVLINVNMGIVML